MEWSIGGIPSVKATRLSSNRKSSTAHAPAGGWLHASAITRASTSPVTFGSTGGVARFLQQMRVLNPPGMRSERLRDQIHGALRVPRPSATTRRSGAGPCISSKASNTLARVINRAGRRPEATTFFSFARSPAVRRP